VARCGQAQGNTSVSAAAPSLRAAQDALVSTVCGTAAKVSRFANYTYTCNKRRPAVLLLNSCPSNTYDITVITVSRAELQPMKPRVRQSLTRSAGVRFVCNWPHDLSMVHIPRKMKITSTNHFHIHSNTFCQHGNVQGQEPACIRRVWAPAGPCTVLNVTA
jgi:hypothetical protein